MCVSTDSQRHHQSQMDTELAHARAPHEERRRRRGRERRRRKHDRRRYAPAHVGAEENGGGSARSARERSLDRYRPREPGADANQARRQRSRSRSPRFRVRSRSRSRSRSRPRPARSTEMESSTRTTEQADRPHEQANGQLNSGSSQHQEMSNGGRSRSWPRERVGGGDGGSRSRGGSRRSKLSVPDNWDDVPKIGTLVGSSRFVAMRVPLDDKFSRMIRSAEELWTPEIFLETQSKDGHDVRLLVDLTNTTKYYDGEVAFRDSNVKYVKLRIEGFKAPPREAEVNEFVRIVDEFVAAEPTGHIAVHCTHGLNRTGYLVVSYLVQRGGLSVQEALKAFSDARPPGLIKHMYVEELFRRYAPDATVELPELPVWAAAKYGARGR